MTTPEQTAFPLSAPANYKFLRMKKSFTLTLVMAILAGGFSAQATPRFKHTPAVSTPEAARTRKAAKAAVAAAIWCPKHQEVSAWEGEWVPVDIYNTTYDRAGRIIDESIESTEDGSVVREQTTYNDNGMAVEKLVTISSNGTDFENSTRSTTQYDSKLTSFVTAAYSWMWLSNQWEQLGNNYTQTITRDANGNIISMERAVLYNGIFDPIMRLTVEYGTDGKAATIIQSDLTYDYNIGDYAWVESAKVTSIVLESTDGQITSATDLYAGGNRILSAHIVNPEDNVDVVATYTENGHTVVRTGEIQGYEAKATVSVEYLDNFGSVRLTETFEADEDGEPYMEKYIDTEMYDAYGYLTLLKNESEFMGEAIVDNISTGTLTYDPTYGYPLTYTTQIGEFDEDTEELVMVNEMYVVLSDYIDAATASVDTPVVDTDAAAEYYNLQGMRVDSAALAPGLYIVRQGGKTFKQIVR